MDKNWGRQLYFYRKKKNLTQEQLAEKLYVSKQAISNWERGLNNPDENLKKVTEEILSMNSVSEKTYYKVNVLSIPQIEDMKTIEEIETAVDTIIGKVEVDVYKVLVKKIAKMALWVAIGFSDGLTRFDVEEWVGIKDPGVCGLTAFWGACSCGIKKSA